MKELIDLLNELPPRTVIEKKEKEWEIDFLSPDGNIISCRGVDIRTTLGNFLELLKHEKRES